MSELITPPCTAIDDQDQDNDDDHIESRLIIIDFGQCEIFKEKTKYVTFLRPQIIEDIQFFIKQNPSVKPMKPSFELEFNQGVLKRDQNFKMAVTYKPTIANIKDYEVYMYRDSENEVIRIDLHGQTIGPYCTLSTKRLKLYKTPKRTLMQRKVEITNHSTVLAYFKIDHTKYDIFTVEPYYGLVKPNGYVYLTIRFHPPGSGLFPRKIFCLFWNSEPLILNLLGICYKDVAIDDDIRYFSQKKSFWGYDAYLEELIDEANTNIRLSDYYVDFGSAMVGSEHNFYMVQVTNNTKQLVRVEWGPGKPNSPFSINPTKLKIPAMTTAAFETTFDPKQNFQVYCGTYIANIKWDLENKNKSTVPLTCVLRLLGNSFQRNEGWLAHYEVLPETVYFLPCLPGERARTTFVLKNKSSVPLFYRLIPPKNRKVRIKPLMGRFRNIEIFVAIFTTEQHKVRTYVEEWKLILNGRENEPIGVFFHGETIIPTVEIGKKNTISVGTLQHGSKKEVEFSMKNTSYFTIMYKFIVGAKTILEFNEVTGSISSNKTVKVTMNVFGTECASNHEQFTCQIYIVDAYGAVSGHYYEQAVDVYSECSYSELCAIPHVKDYGCMQFNRKIRTDFNAINFGLSSVFFQACQTGDGEIDRSFRIKPAFGEVLPRGLIRFSVMGVVSGLGEQYIEFGYFNRMVKNSPMVTGNPITLFTLKYFGEYPIVQFEEIVDLNLGPLFSKMEIYEHYLQVAKINQLICEVQESEMLTIELRLPDFEVQEKEFYIILSLANTSRFDTKVDIKREINCQCQPAEVSLGLTKRKMDFSCPHRQVCNMELRDKHFQAHTSKCLKITIRYLIPGETIVRFILELSNGREIEIFLTMYGISEDEPKLSTFGPDFNMLLEDIHLRTRVAPSQFFWVYNNTKNLLNFKLDTDPLVIFCQTCGFDVFKVLNPVDQLMPYERKVILVKFLPIEVKQYAISLDLSYWIASSPDNEESTELVIEGNGVMVHRDHKTAVAKPNFSKYTGEFPISLSLESLEIKSFPVWNKRKELIFMKNCSRDKILQCIWKRVEIKDNLEIVTEPPYTIIKPNEIQPVVIVVKSLALPCIGSVYLTCEIVYVSDQVKRKLTQEKFDLAEERINMHMEDKPYCFKRPINPIRVHPEHEPLYASIDIKFSSIHNRDLDHEVDPSVQVKQFPNQSMENVPKSLNKTYHHQPTELIYPERNMCVRIDHKDIVCRTMEDMIADVVFSKSLKYLLELSSKDPPHYYNDFVMNDTLIKRDRPLTNSDLDIFRKKEEEKFCNHIKLAELSNIMQDLIYKATCQLVQVCVGEVNLKDLYDEIEKSLYICNKHKKCDCTVSE